MKQTVKIILLFLAFNFLSSQSADLSYEDEVAGLPDRIYLKSRTRGFNSKYYYALSSNGRIFIKPNPESGYPGEWHPMGKGEGLPYDEEKKRLYEVHEITEISVDNNKLVALTDGGRVYHIDFILQPESTYKWKSKWGHPLGDGPGLYMPRRSLAWSLSHADPEVVRYYDDPSGNRFNHYCTSLFVLYPNGQEIHFSDPWTPADWAYQILTPYNGSFKALNMDSSSSTVFVINKYGDMFTRQVDFDLLGANPSPLIRYSYYPQKVREEVYNFYMTRTLPPQDWQMQPKINGKITKEITIITTGEGSFARELRVKGINSEGEPGYWSKQLNESEWAEVNFQVVPDMYIEESELLENVDQDMSRYSASTLQRFSYVGELDDRVTAEIDDFYFYDSPVTITFNIEGGGTLSFQLHHHITFRTTINDEAGFDGTMLKLEGVLAVPAESYEDEDTASFLKTYFPGGKPSHPESYIPVLIEVNNRELRLATKRLVNKKYIFRSVDEQ